MSGSVSSVVSFLKIGAVDPMPKLHKILGADDSAAIKYSTHPAEAILAHFDCVMTDVFKDNYAGRVNSKEVSTKHGPGKWVIVSEIVSAAYSDADNVTGSTDIVDVIRTVEKVQKGYFSSSAIVDYVVAGQLMMVTAGSAATERQGPADGSIGPDNIATAGSIDDYAGLLNATISLRKTNDSLLSINLALNREVAQLRKKVNTQRASGSCRRPIAVMVASAGEDTLAKFSESIKSFDRSTLMSRKDRDRKLGKV